MARLIGHMLLALCLILNGIGGAAMAAAMPLAHANAVSPSMDSHADEACPDQVAPSAPTAEHPSIHPAPADSDCCDQERCDGACAQYAVAAPEFAPSIGTDDLGLGYRLSAAPSHADPALQRAVRPPIA